MKKSPNSEKLSTEILAISSENPSVETEGQVRYSETDRMGIAHNKNYFEWFEIGRTEYCRQMNIPYSEIEKRGYYLVVVEAFCRYKKALSYDDKFIIYTSLKELTPKKAVFSYRLLTKSERLTAAEGYTVHIVTNSKAEVSSLPREILDKIQGGSA